MSVLNLTTIVATSELKIGLHLQTFKYRPVKVSEHWLQVYVESKTVFYVTMCLFLSLSLLSPFCHFSSAFGCAILAAAVAYLSNLEHSKSLPSHYLSSAMSDNRFTIILWTFFAATEAGQKPTSGPGHIFFAPKSIWLGKIEELKRIGSVLSLSSLS